MSDLVTITDQKAVTTSLIIAEAFEKKHMHVLRSIRELECSAAFTESNFGLSSYLDSTGRALPMYTITRDGFVFLAMGFTGKRAAEFKERFIEQFNAMERALLEGTGERRTIDVNHRHQRGVTNPTGLDIDFRMDLTKLVMHPTRDSLAVLERLTGITMSDLLAEPVNPDDDLFGEVFASFYELRCDTAPANERLLFKGVYAAFVRHLGTMTEPIFVSRRRFSRAMQNAGHKVINHGGSSYITGLRLRDPLAH